MLSPTEVKAQIAAPFEHVLWGEYAEAGQPVGTLYDRFVAEAAKRHGVTKTKVRRSLATAIQHFTASFQNQIGTKAQAVADLVGAGLIEAVTTLKEGLKAVHQKPLLDRGGKPVIDDGTGKPVVFSAPNWDARISSAKALIDLHPKPRQEIKVETEEHHYHHMSDADLMVEFEEIRNRLERFASNAKTIDVRASGAIEEGEAARTGIGLPEDRKRPGLLVAAPHEDEGRAGSTEPL